MFKILDGVCTPKRGTKYSAYVDLFSRKDYIIGAGETKVIKLGVKIDWRAIMKICVSLEPFSTADDDIKEYEKFMSSHYLEIALRSSLGAKGLIIANGIGIIDLDYPDEIGLIVHNPLKPYELNEPDIDESHYELVSESDSYLINKGDKVAQCTLKEHKGYLMGYESDVVRVSGFGSTGIWIKSNSQLINQ